MPEPLDRRLGHQLEELKLDPGVDLAEPGYRGREEGRVGGWKGRHSDAAGPQTHDFIELSLSITQPRQDRVDMSGECPPGVGHQNSARTAYDQRRAGFPLQGRKLLRDRGRRVGKGVGGCT